MPAYRFLPDLSAEAIADIQAAGLNWTCRHAFAGSPVYRERLAEAGYEPGQELTLDDLTSLPLTSVEDLRARHKRWCDGVHPHRSNSAQPNWTDLIDPIHKVHKMT